VPTPLPDAERRRFIEKALSLGVPHDRIKADLAALEGYGPLSVTTTPMQNMDAARLPGGGPPVSPAEQAQGMEFMTRTLPRGAAAAIPAALATMATGGMALPTAMAIEGAAAGAGDLVYQGINRAVRGEQIKPIESLKVAGVQAAGTGILRPAFDALSTLAGAPPRVIRFLRDVRMTGRYSRTFGEPKDAAEHQLGQGIKSAVDKWRSQKTGPRIEKEAILRDATDSGVKIPAQPIIDALEETKLRTPKTDVGEKLNSALSTIQTRFMNVRTSPVNFAQGQIRGKVSRMPRTDLTPSEIDEMLTREFDNRIYTMSGDPKDQPLAEALADARGAIRETLLSALPDRARQLTEATYAELSKREEVGKFLSPGLISLETKIRNIFKPGNAGDLDALQYVSKVTGIDYYGAALKLAQKRATIPDPRQAAKGLDFVMELIRKGTARPAVKILAPLQPVTNVAPGAVYAGTLEERRRRGNQ
jgi:hypothetical protein